MKKFFIILTAIYLFFLALSGLLISIISFTPLIVKMETFPANSLIFSLLFISWLIATGVGMLLKQNWSRYSIFLMSGFAILLGITFCFLFSFITSPEMNDSLRTFIIGLLIIFLIFIPVVYLIFFSRRSVKELFIAQDTSNFANTANRPVGISILAILYLCSGIFSIIAVLLPRYHALSLLGKIIISGISLKIYTLIIGFILLYIAYGFWKLQKAAWITYLFFGCYGLITGLINMFTFNKNMMSGMITQDYDNPLINPSFFKITGISVLLIDLALLVYVISKKALFFNDDFSSNQPNLTTG